MEMYHNDTNCTMRGFKNRQENNWCLLCKKSVYDIKDHMEDHYHLSELSQQGIGKATDVNSGGVNPLE